MFKRDQGNEAVRVASNRVFLASVRRQPRTSRTLVKKTVAEIRRSKESVPEPISSRSFSGKFVVRVPPEVHRLLAIQAAESGVSLNRLVSSKLA